MADATAVRQESSFVSFGQGGSIEAVRDGARVSGGRGDTLLAIHDYEHQRRRAGGLGSVTDLWLLDRLLTLPADETISWDDLNQTDTLLVKKAHPAVIERSTRGVRRLLRQPVDVRLVVVREPRWRTGLRAAAAFEAFAQRVLLMPSPPKKISELLWEAGLLGVGVWVGPTDSPDQLIPPAPWKRRYVKGAGWRFAERAYDAWLNAKCQQESSAAALGHPAQPVDVAMGQLQLPIAPDATTHDA